MTSFLLSLLPDLQGLYLIPAELTQAIINILHYNYHEMIPWTLNPKSYLTLSELTQAIIIIIIIMYFI